MDKGGVEDALKLGDRSTSDIIIHLKNRDGWIEQFYCHSSILSVKSKFFAKKISESLSTSLDSRCCVEVSCSGSEYEHYVKLLRLLYISPESILDSWDSMQSALGVLQVAVTLCCEEITQSCIQYLEAAPWEEKEEEVVILKTVASLGAAAMPILARIEPVDLSGAKNVFISAIRFATSTDISCPPFTNELKTSAQEQIEYMLVEDEDVPLVTADDDVKSEVKIGLSKMFSFMMEVVSLLSESDGSLEPAEKKVLQSLSDVEWMCNILPKMDMMKDFVCLWSGISINILDVVQDKKFSCNIWSIKVKLMEVTGKVLEAVGYGHVILPALARVQLLKIWLPYIRMMKPLLDSKYADDAAFAYKLDDDLCQGIEGAIVSLVLALPSNDQADILTDWMRAEQVRYPDLSEAFEVWCYRTKAAKRRLEVGFNDVGNATVSL